MPYKKQIASRKATGHKDKRNSDKAVNLMITVRLPSDLFEKIKLIAADKQQSMSYTIFEELRGLYG